MPPDLLREAAHRLGVMALLGGALWIIAVVADHLAMRAMATPGTPWGGLAVQDYIAMVVVAVSVGLYTYSRRADRNPGVMLTLDWPT